MVEGPTKHSSLYTMSFWLAIIDYVVHFISELRGMKIEQTVPSGIFEMTMAWTISWSISTVKSSCNILHFMDYDPDVRHACNSEAKFKSEAVGLEVKRSGSL